MKKETPILFSTPMVKGILNNSKNRTRRTRGLEIINQNPNDRKFDAPYFRTGFKKSDNATFAEFINKKGETIKCKFPFGEVGDLLWVRESFVIIPPNYVFYKADKDNSADIKWKPSIHMPKVACRIWLEITNIRVERLQSITEDDIKKEGIRIPVTKCNGIDTIFLELGKENSAFKFLPNFEPSNIDLQNYDILFALWAELWCKINGRESWDLNPWLWVIEFKQVTKPTIHE
ncbi:MAG: hypothetical protein WCX31_04665 [Salinivirgaceae bacterium]